MKMNMITTEEYEKVCGNIAEMDDEEFNALFLLTLYERLRRYYDTYIESPKQFQGSWSHEFAGGHGRLNVWLQETTIRQGVL